MATVLHRPSEDTYLVLVPATLGLVGVAAILGQPGRYVSRAKILVRAIFAAGTALVAIGIAPTVLNFFHDLSFIVPITVLFSGIFGCGLGALLIPAFAVLQERTTEESRGRIFGGIFSVINAAVALPLLLAGSLADAFGVDRVVAGLGILLFVVGVLAKTVWASRLTVLEHDVSL
jgi:MFS family permease